MITFPDEGFMCNLKKNNRPDIYNKLVIAQQYVCAFVLYLLAFEQES